MNAKMRRMETNLSTLGSGVIVFGVWSFIKFSLTFMVYGKQIGDEISALGKAIMFALMWFVALADFLIHFYIGKSARSESKGKHKRPFYLIVAGAVAFLQVISVLAEILILVLLPEQLLNTIVLMIIDASLLVIVIELIANARGIRNLRKKEALA